MRAVRDVLSGIRFYFDRCLAIFLLYRFERPQYDQLARDRPDDVDKPSSLYGSEHLMRLIVKLPDLLPHAGLTTEESEVIVDTILDLLKFLSKHAALFFTTDNYHKATPEYCAAYDAQAALAMAHKAHGHGGAGVGGGAAGGAGIGVGGSGAAGGGKPRISSMFASTTGTGSAGTGSSSAAAAGR